MSRVLVKRDGSDEPFDIKKLYASIYTAMLVAHESTKVAEFVASQVSHHVDTWAKGYSDLSTKDIHTEAAKKLLEYNAQAQFLYVHHKVIF